MACGPPTRVGTQPGSTALLSTAGERRATAGDVMVLVRKRRELAGLIMRGGEPPSLKKLKPGALLTEQGQAGDEVFLVLDGVLTRHPTLRGGVHDRQQTDIATLAESVAKRRGLSKPDESCFLLGAVFLLTYRRALTAWMAGPASADLAAMITHNFELLKGLLGPTSPNGLRRT